MADPMQEELDKEFVNFYPVNPLLTYRSYSYHHVLFMCDSTDTAEELIVELGSESSASNAASTALATRYAEQIISGRSSLSDGTEGRIKQTTNGKYVVITNGTINSDYIINSLKWSSISAANVFPGDQYTSLATDGEFRVVEPRGIKFFNTLAESCKLLQIGAESAVFVLKTYFVGYTNDSVQDAVEIISSVKPLMFYMIDIVGTFTEDGGAYDIQFVAVSNGATRRPHTMRMENFSGQLDKSLKGSLAKLERYINEESASYFDCVKTASAVFSSTNAELPPDQEVMTADKLIPVEYDIFIDKMYDSEAYTANNSQQAYKERGVCVEPVNIKLGPMSVESAIRAIMESSIQVLVDRKGGEQGTGIKYDYRIHSVVKSSSPNGSKGKPKVRVMYFVTRYHVPSYDLIAKLVAMHDTTGKIEGLDYDEAKRLVQNNLMAYRYVYTGRNIDILNFDIKMQMGLAFFQIVSQTNNIKEHMQTTPSVGVGGSAIHQTGTADSVYTPIFLGTNLRSPKGFNTVDAGSAITYNSAMSRQASVENVEAKMTIVGNPIYLGRMSHNPSDYSYANTEFVGVTGKQPDPVQPEPNDTGEPTKATMKDWGFFPGLARVQVFMPKSSDDIDSRNTARTTGTSYSEEFWYDGYYYILGVTNIFEEGKFTQELDLLSTPKLMTDATLKDQNAKFDKQLTECINKKHRVASPAQPPAPSAPTQPAAPKTKEPTKVVNQDPYTVKQGAWSLGQTSAREESNGDPGAVNPKDANGLPSYGSYQLNGGTLNNFIRTSAYKDKFAGLTPNSAAFTQRWKQVAQEDREGFKKDQHDFIQRTHYDVLRSKFTPTNLKSLNSRGPSVQDMMWSTSVQYGPGLANSIFKNALKSYNVDSMTDCEIVKVVQQYKSDNVHKHFTGSPGSTSYRWAEAVKNNRIPRETTALLALCGEKAPVGPKETNTTPQQEVKPSEPTGQPAPPNVSTHDTVVAAKGDEKPEGKSPCDLMLEEQMRAASDKFEKQQAEGKTAVETQQKDVNKAYEERTKYSEDKQKLIKQKVSEYNTLEAQYRSAVEDAKAAEKSVKINEETLANLNNAGSTGTQDYTAAKQKTTQVLEQQKGKMLQARQKAVATKEKMDQIQTEIKQITDSK